ncbi:hypothetical protein PLESTB_001254200 [Pleodorina starrii]|uniref:COX assembly mitochondrial protein n=1 Tax=Pleodorina starrii TaxID=330485 RepID=A0A9W6F6K2_9CHLO|nr:hypothetical protein PLESTM_000205900 [Pleodorina starrii]GLC57690.1 hypothetical protein PLESTB_001254200 [Pleodorina starrii]GLC63359.1 hypothetical protein PLESTF_000028000 [Pleodorina starrii]
MAATATDTVASGLVRSGAEAVEDSHVSPHARNKIVLKLSRIGEERCKSFIEDFNLCCKGRSFGQIFCKGKYNASQECIHRYMNEANFELVARRWISAGRPRKPDWGELLAGVQEEGDRLGRGAAERAGAAKS